MSCDPRRRFRWPKRSQVVKPDPTKSGRKQEIRLKRQTHYQTWLAHDTISERSIWKVQGGSHGRNSFRHMGEIALTNSLCWPMTNSDAPNILTRT